jgi:hypothetical protein
MHCAVCLQECTQNVEITVCNHTFHKLCLQDWFRYKTTCPLCKTNIKDHRIMDDDNETIISDSLSDSSEMEYF